MRTLVLGNAMDYAKTTGTSNINIPASQPESYKHSPLLVYDHKGEMRTGYAHIQRIVTPWKNKNQ
jgi:hypothetical protein